MSSAQVNNTVGDDNSGSGEVSYDVSISIDGVSGDGASSSDGADSGQHADQHHRQGSVERTSPPLGNDEPRGEEGLRDVDGLVKADDVGYQRGRVQGSAGRRWSRSRSRSNVGRDGRSGGRSRLDLSHSPDRYRDGGRRWRNRSSSRGRSRSRSRDRRGRSRSRSRDRSRGRSRSRSRDRRVGRLRRSRSGGSRSRDRGDDYVGRRGGGRDRSRSGEGSGRYRTPSPLVRRAGQREGSRSQGRDDEIDTLFVGDLPWKASSNDLAQLFDSVVPAGILEARVMAGKQYGFVTFRDPHVARTILSEAGEGGTGPAVYMEGHKLRVRQSSQANKRVRDGCPPPSPHGQDHPSSPNQDRTRQHQHRGAPRPRLQDAHVPSPAERQARAAAAALVFSAQALLQQAGPMRLGPGRGPGGSSQGGMQLNMNMMNAQAPRGMLSYDDL